MVRSCRDIVISNWVPLFETPCITRAVLHVFSSFSKATFIHQVLPLALPERSLSTEPFHCSENIASSCIGRHGCPVVKHVTFPAFPLLVFSGMAKLTDQLSPGVQRTGQEVYHWLLWALVMLQEFFSLFCSRHTFS